MKRALLLLLLSAVFVVGCGGGGAATRSSLELINPALGPDYSSWMAGAAARLATPEEINEYITLGDDTQAAAFIERFWQKHNPTPGRPNPVREAFEMRSAVADGRYSESGQIGRRTDRGVIYVLYGLPKKIDHEVSPVRNGPPLEVWIYGTDAGSGLDGQRPNPIYRFVKSGDLTVLYHGRVAPRALPLGELPE